MRQRSLGLIASGAVIAGVLAAVPAATAAPNTSSEPVAGQAQRFTDGRYVVLLREPGAASYAGGDRRYAATRATDGEQFRAGSTAVRQYTAHLRSTHRQIADEVGTDVATSYTIGANGFAARLTAEQALDLASDRRVLLVQADEARHLDTWNTPDALGMTGKSGAWRRHASRGTAGNGAVVGIIDSGIWPESKSFRGYELTESPKTRWDLTMTGTSTRMEKADGGVFTGECQTGEGWETTDLCSTKLIGARYYADAFVDSVPEEHRSEHEVISTRDGDGHGTHVASTAAGRIVHKVATEGRRFGTVSGMAPGARIAAYKVCWEDDDPDTGGCYTSSILDAIDDAIADGVDSINMSISGAQDTVVDSVEIAFEGAAEAGIFVAVSAGNSGPDASTVAHNSPWLTTVAATTHHNFENTVVLGNGTKLVGASIAGKAVPSTPMIDSAEAVVAGGDVDEATLCAPDTLDPAAVTGKIVVCLRGVYDRVAKSAEVERAGGVAMILVNPSPNSLDADFHAAPTVHVSDVAGEKVYDYLATANPRAEIRLGNLTKQKTPVPQVAGFSSRGPATANESDILKPDLGAPGQSILAAVAPPSNSDRDYDLYSGTSMASPHIAGLAAFMLAERPQWTAEQVKSAMMTTATTVRGADGKRSTDLFGQGAGQVTPKKFFDPGLFVTSGRAEWRGFLTGQGLDTGVPALAAKDLNMPSMAQGQVTGSTSFTRTFRSSRAGSWKVSVQVPGFSATPSTPTLVAGRPGDIEDLTIDFTRTDAPLGEFAFGYVWLSGPTVVKIPVALRPVSVAAPASVSGTGTEGSVEVPITAAFTGDLEVGVTGLAKAETVESSVPEADQAYECVTVEEGTKLARFDLDSVDDTADLDLYVYAAETCDINTAYAFVGQSATGAADESLTIEAPDAPAYILEIDGYSAGDAGSPIEYVLDSYLVDAHATLGDLTVTPNPVPVVNGEDTSFDVSWSGLDADARYLGMLEYDGALAPTFVEVDTTS